MTFNYFFLIHSVTKKTFRLHKHPTKIIFLLFITITSLNSIQNTSASGPDDIKDLKDIDQEFWNKGNHGTMIGVDGTQLRYVYFKSLTSASTVVISSGRTQSFIHYEEMIRELHNRGAAVFVMDHRGQGLSGRLLDDPQIGHVEDYNHYIIDFKQFIDEIVTPNAVGKRYLFGHSLGGALAVRYLLNNPEPGFTRAILSAPMFKIRLPFRDWVARTILRVNAFICGWRGYVPGGGQAYHKPQTTNIRFSARDWATVSLIRLSTFLTGLLSYLPGRGDKPRLTRKQKSQRMKHYLALYEVNEALQLGSPSNLWMDQAMVLSNDILEEIDQLSVPTTIFYATADRIVLNSALEEISRRSDQVSLIKLEGSSHEIMFENDNIRNRLMTEIVQQFIPPETATISADSDGTDYMSLALSSSESQDSNSNQSRAVTSTDELGEPESPPKTYIHPPLNVLTPANMDFDDLVIPQSLLPQATSM